MYQVKINQNQPKLVDSLDINWDIVPVGMDRFHIIKDHRSYEAVIVSSDFVNKTFDIRIGTIVHHIELKDQFDLLAEKLGLGASSQKKLNQIKAPMPGMVLEVLVKEGQEVSKGQSVLILEAMKMENVIKASDDAVVKTVKVIKGNPVEKNQILIEFQ
jgi:biotin carboxyl carrier protein